MELVAFVCLIATMWGTQAHGKSSSNSNPADELAAVINQNRTSIKLPSLYNNPGLACMALQYIQAYEGQCSKVQPDGEKPSEAEFKAGFAENCGVVAASVSKVTGIVLACETDLKDPTFAFNNLLFGQEKTLQTLRSKNQTEFGVAISGYQGGSPYFWCVVFSSGSPNATFRFAEKTAKFQKTGCFSGTGQPCSSGTQGPGYYMSMLRFLLVGILSFCFIHREQAPAKKPLLEFSDPETRQAMYM